MNEPTLYFITKDNHVKRIDSTVKDITYKNVQADDYEISLNGKRYKIDRETWEYINWWALVVSVIFEFILFIAIICIKK